MDNTTLLFSDQDVSVNGITKQQQSTRDVRQPCEDNTRKSGVEGIWQQTPKFSAFNNTLSDAELLLGP
ncbi:hypothetical protein TNCV_82851 [Trichonephila clavipes]|nr:hypothetical protein TNCV_82851 [Trichonephila clavipes]